jgi:hypothetical protein
VPVPLAAVARCATHKRADVPWRSAGVLSILDASRQWGRRPLNRDCNDSRQPLLGYQVNAAATDPTTPAEARTRVEERHHS